MKKHERGGGGSADEDLLARVAAKDRAAFEELYRRYYAPLQRFIYRVARRLDTVDETINDVMMVVWEKANTCNHDSKVSTWIMGIAYKKALKAIVAQTAEPSQVDIDELEPLIPGNSDQGIQDLELENWLAQALDLLSPEQRAVMELTCKQGLRYQEVAAILGCPEATVKTRIFHARKKLQSLRPDLQAEAYSPCPTAA